jgi:plasmid stability protein
MDFHMKTTLQIDDGVMRELKMRAARDGRTMSELVEAALRRLLDERPPGKDLPPLPVMRARELVDVSDRDALYRAMEEP